MDLKFVVESWFSDSRQQTTVLSIESRVSRLSTLDSRSRSRLTHDGDSTTLDKNTIESGNQYSSPRSGCC